jgi:hypothetical protein
VGDVVLDDLGNIDVFRMNGHVGLQTEYVKTAHGNPWVKNQSETRTVL